MACRFGAKTLLIALVVLVVPALSAPTLKESVSNKVIQDDQQLTTDDEQEKIVASLILQLARDYDEGRLSLIDLVGRSAVDENDQEPEGKALPQDLTKPTGEKILSERKPVRTT